MGKWFILDRLPFPNLTLGNQLMSSWGFRGWLVLRGPVNFGYKEELLQKSDMHRAFVYPLHQRSSLANMGFPHLLTTDEMMFYVMGNFEW